MEWWEDKEMPRTVVFLACASLIAGAILSLLYRAWTPILYVLAGLLVGCVIMAVMTGLNALLFIPLFKLMARSPTDKQKAASKQKE